MRYYNIKPKIVAKKLIDFISDVTASKGFGKVVLGLSGGLDSTVVAYLSKAALGKENVIGILMPYGRLSNEASQHAGKIIKILKIRTERVDITQMIDAYFKKIKTPDNIRRGNKMARERMSILYDLSEKYNSLVIGASNRTELLLGYSTVYGDSACAINPVGSLYKTQLKCLARYLRIPSYILNKPPSADFWHGQTDEDELGYMYEAIDKLLFFMFDKRLANSELVQKGFSPGFIQDIRKRIKRNRFKSQLPVAAKL
jgi:NAD+ synthase